MRRQQNVRSIQPILQIVQRPEQKNVGIEIEQLVDCVAPEQIAQKIWLYRSAGFENGVLEQEGLDVVNSNLRNQYGKKRLVVGGEVACRRIEQQNVQRSAGMKRVPRICQDPRHGQVVFRDDGASGKWLCAISHGVE